MLCTCENLQYVLYLNAYIVTKLRSLFSSCTKNVFILIESPFDCHITCERFTFVTLGMPS